MGHSLQASRTPLRGPVLAGRRLACIEKDPQGQSCDDQRGSDHLPQQAVWRFPTIGSVYHFASIGSSASNPILRGTYAKLPINLGNRPRVRQEHFPNFLGPKSDHNGFFYGR